MSPSLLYWSKQIAILNLVDWKYIIFTLLDTEPKSARGMLDCRLCPNIIIEREPMSKVQDDSQSKMLDTRILTLNVGIVASLVNPPHFII
jgi:hypothetical protein